MNHQSEIPHIFCPYCFYPISITHKKDDNSKIIMHCENCGQKEINFENFFSLIKKNANKPCNFCCKTFALNELYYSKKNSHFLCSQCYMDFFNKNEINSNNYKNLKSIGIFCDIHNNIKYSLFCLVCQKHLCSECRVKHASHKIINLSEESKNKKNIDEINSIIKKEEEDIKYQEKLGDLLLNSILGIFEDNVKRRKEIHIFKKIIYQYFCVNSNNYNTYKTIDIIFQQENNPDMFINQKDLKELDQILNIIGQNSNKKIKNNTNNNQSKTQKINNNKNNHSKEEDDRRSLSAMKQSKKKSVTLPSLPKLNLSNSSIIKNNNNINNKSNNKVESKTPMKLNRRKNSYLLPTPIKTQRTKNKKYVEQSNNMINQQINNKNSKFFYTGLKVNLPKEPKVDNNIANILKLNNSIMNFLFIGSNKVLISSFSQNKNLVLTELIKEKEDDKYKIYMKILSAIQIGKRPIIHMELCENGNILACSDEKIYLFKIVNNKINIQYIFPNDEEKSPFNNNLHIISCTSVGDDKFILLQKSEENGNVNVAIDLTLTNNSPLNKFTFDKIPIRKDNTIISIEKISKNNCILITQKINSNKSNNNNNEVYFALTKIENRKIIIPYIKEFKFKEKMSKYFIKKLLDNYLIVSESNNSLVVFDYINKANISSIKCDNIISMEIKNIDNEQAYLYTIEKRVIDEKINEELRMKKYFIKKLMKSKLSSNNNVSNKTIYEFDISCINNVILSQKNKPNKINDMIVIEDNDKKQNDNNGSEKNLVLLADNEGNVFLKYY